MDINAQLEQITNDHKNTPVELGPSEKVVYNKSLMLLSRREHSKFELRNKLLSKGYNKDTIEKILHLLSKLNYQSDQRYRNAKIRSLITKNQSIQNIQQILSQEKIQMTTTEIEQVASDLEYNSEEVIEMIVKKKLRNFSSVDESKIIQKKRNSILMYLSRKGHPIDLSIKVLNRFLSHTDV